MPRIVSLTLVHRLKTDWSSYGWCKSAVSSWELPLARRVRRDNPSETGQESTRTLRQRRSCSQQQRRRRRRWWKAGSEPPRVTAERACCCSLMAWLCLSHAVLSSVLDNKTYFCWRPDFFGRDGGRFLERWRRIFGVK